MVNVAKYTAITFAPVQGFIEKSRKLRDLYGASLILSYLSQQLVKEAEKTTTVISPAIPNLQKGMPNRILIKGEFSKSEVEKTLLSVWKGMLKECRCWIEEKLPDYKYHWEREWANWGNHAWEIFWGEGDSIQAAMDDLETRKLSRGWTAVNWIGESSSLTGTDGIAFPGLGGEARNPKLITYPSEKGEIENFYTALAALTEKLEKETPEGKFIAPNEKLSIPELVKRLVTWDKIQEKLDIEALDKGFKEIQRKPQIAENVPGQWTGWFMGDGDKVGDHLKNLAVTDNGDHEIENFSYAMRRWGEKFDKNFPEDLGRVVYAGGDDFLGIIYSKNPAEPIPPLKAFEWLMTLNEQWKKHKQPLTLSVGFVWVAGSVPQRDVLQHCREAEKRAKSLGRDRVTIRVVFNSGQYVQWTCPWDYLDILKKYRDRNGKTFTEWESKGCDQKYFPNWTHIYSDLAQLKARHAISLNGKQKNVDERIALELFNLYFEQHKEYLENHQEKIVGYSDNIELIKWIDGLIHIGWHLCSII
ncbi:MAG: type III-B CRISPR-associated protein Cas10/Cmr2 [Nostoc sp. DedQUE08]|uniref:Cas10/Cmr2 second palm domain-containing protein n=1 Tax=Nostoc sp. DedQUE08 TaxID=3075393 RepID=UPI002AD5369B|nr:type III-B CRISPR-associated protein Cas10/Cmr2 [Nostoc sp. DedQUE08]MDZ8066047.1 type III-B CRISPR-associated protein Cas10/Cmr2 [Nostoc sp. DedQUE08]